MAAGDSRHRRAQAGRCSVRLPPRHRVVRRNNLSSPARWRPPGRRRRSSGRHPAMPCRDGVSLRRLRPPGLPPLQRAPVRPSIKRQRRRGPPHPNRARCVRRVWPSTALRRLHHGRLPSGRRRRASCSSNSSGNGRSSGRHNHRPRLRQLCGRNLRRRNQPFSRRLRFRRHKMAARQRAVATPILRWWRRRSMAPQSSIPGRFRREARAPRRNRRTCLCRRCCRGRRVDRAIRS